MSDLFKLENTYHNGSTTISPNERPEMTAFNNSAIEVLKLATELARAVTRSHQGAATLLVDGDWSQGRKYFSLSEKYAQWADYNTPATGFGIHGYVTKINYPLRLTQSELEAHPEWRDFGVEKAKHPPMRGWLVMPLIGVDGLNYGFVQVTDRYEGDFTAEDEANLTRLGKLTSTALDALAQAHLPEYHEKVEKLEKLAHSSRPDFLELQSPE